MLNYSSEKKVGQKVGQRKIKSIRKAFKLLKLKGFLNFFKRREEMKMQSTIGYEMCNQWCFVNRYRIFVSKKFFILYIPISCL